jgi:hypothetical protein
MSKGGIIAASRRRTAAVSVMPSIRAIGVYGSALASNQVYPIPGAYQPNDILLWVIECSDTAGLAPPAGWAHVTNSPKSQGTNVEALNVYWKRAVSGETSPVTSAVSSNHQIGVIIAVQDCITTGNPWDGTPGVAGAAASTSFALTAQSSTVDNCLSILFAASANDATTDQFGTFSFANSNITNITKRSQQGTLNGNGGSIDIVTGEKAVAGGGGNWLATHVSGTWVGINLHLKPA